MRTIDPLSLSPNTSLGMPEAHPTAHPVDDRLDPSHLPRVAKPAGIV
jgi:hypothetical protein